MVGEVARNRKFAPVQRGIPESVDSVFRRNLQRYEIPPRAANNHFGIDDSHFKFSSPVAPLSASLKQ